MKTVGQTVLYPARASLPFIGAICPVRTVRDIGPGTDIGKPGHQRINVAVKPVKPGHRSGHHIGRQHPLVNQRQKQIGKHIIMVFMQALPKIRN